MALPLVIVHDLDVPCRAFPPLEAYSPLIVDADAVLLAPIAVQRFEVVARRNTQIFESLGRIDGKKL